MKSDGSVQLSTDALFALAAPSTDDTIREEVERRLAEGEKVTAALPPVFVASRRAD